VIKSWEESNVEERIGWSLEELFYGLCTNLGLPGSLCMIGDYVNMPPYGQTTSYVVDDRKLIECDVVESLIPDWLLVSPCMVEYDSWDYEGWSRIGGDSCEQRARTCQEYESLTSYTLDTYSAPNEARPLYVSQGHMRVEDSVWHELLIYLWRWRQRDILDAPFLGTVSNAIDLFPQYAPDQPQPVPISVPMPPIREPTAPPYPWEY
jgi:hypothetical protein